MVQKTHKFLAIIPARGGSKRVKNKNISLLDGKPLIYYTINEAQKSRFLDFVVVSTDSPAIAEVAHKYGATVPFLRPSWFSDDNSGSVDVVLHAIEFYKKQNVFFENTILLQPTSPLRGVGDIDGAIESFLEKEADAIVSVAKCVHSPLLANRLDQTLSMSDFLRVEDGVRSQDLVPYYRINGAIYIVKTDKFLIQKSFYKHNKIFAYIMKDINSIDIDEEIDFMYAEAILKHGKSNINS